MGRRINFGIKAATLLAAALTACAPVTRSREQSYGLRAVEITISDENLAGVLNGGTEKESFPARLATDSSVLRGELSLSGQGSIYDPKKSFDFRVDDPPGESDLQRIKLSAQFQDRSFLRGLLGWRILSFIGLDPPLTDPVAVYINDKYAGLYLWIEKIDDRFYARKGQPATRVYGSRSLRADFGPEVSANPSLGFKSEFGPFNEHELRQVARWANQPASEAELAQVTPILDLTNMVTYLATNTFLANCDGFKNNFYLWVPERGARLRFTPWDWERIYDTRCPEHSALALVASVPLGARTLEYPDLRSDFRAMLSELAREFPLTELATILDEESRRIDPAYAADPYLGGIGLDLHSKRAQLEEKVRSTPAEIGEFIASG